MNWHIEFAPEVELDVAEAADWYEIRQPGLGAQFIEDIIRVWGALSGYSRIDERASRPS
jgi:hypothetical protein